MPSQVKIRTLRIQILTKINNLGDDKIFILLLLHKSFYDFYHDKVIYNADNSSNHFIAIEYLKLHHNPLYNKILIFFYMYISIYIYIYTHIFIWIIVCSSITFLLNVLIGYWRHSPKMTFKRVKFKLFICIFISYSFYCTQRYKYSENFTFGASDGNILYLHIHYTHLGKLSPLIFI